MKTAVFPGSFDPFTLGHLDIVKRSLPLFDKIIIGIGNNSEKKYMFPLEDRISKLEKIFSDQSKVEIRSYKGLTADFCRDRNAGFIIRGLRNASDLSFEAPIAQMNKNLGNHPETFFLVASPEFSAVSSTILRDIIRHGGDITPYIPA